MFLLVYILNDIQVNYELTVTFIVLFSAHVHTCDICFVSCDSVLIALV